MDDGQWRQAAAYDYEAAHVTTVGHAAWTGLSAATHSLDVQRGFDFNCAEPFFRLLVVLDEVGGRIRGQANDEPRETANPAPNRMYFLPPGQSHWQFGDRQRYLRYIGLRFSDASLTRLFEDDPRPKLSDAPVLGFTSPRLLALGRLFEMECRDGGASGPLFGDSLSISLISLLTRVGPAPRAKSSGGLTARQLKTVTDYLDAHLAQPVDPGSLAQLVRLSTSHFHRAFKASTGLPPHAWLTELRLQRARELMLDTGLSLAQVALQTGFADQPHFTRIFTRSIGVSPRAWRKTVSG